jgi:2-aminobenzoate-CoA ligase
VIAAPDPDRGNIVKAFIVLRDGFDGDDILVKTLQDFVKNEIAPYKYPRAISFIEELPKTQTGKLQRFRLRDLETP